MAVHVRCPNPACGKTAEVPEERLGHAVRCGRCGHKFTLPSVGLNVAPPTLTPGARETVGASAPAGAAGVPQQVGRFQVRARLGAGAFGTVYRAYDPQLDREVALKVPQPGTLDNPTAVARFLREARAAARLHHPHIVPVYDAGSDGTHHYIASAFIEGQTLAQAVERGPFDCHRAAEVVRDLAEALDHAHRLGIVHRDLKPANVLLDRQGRPHLTDFGLAHRQDAATRLTHEGAILGTPAYMAPEEALGRHGDARPASDQYSLGVVLYELLCGQTPFAGPAPVVLYNAVHQEPPALRGLRPDVPPELEAICRKAMAKRPEGRYDSCQELADGLRRWLSAEPVRVRHARLAPKTVPRPVRLPILVAAGAAAFAVVLVGAVLAVALFARRPGLPPPEGAEGAGPDAGAEVVNSPTGVPQPRESTQPEKAPEPEKPSPPPPPAKVNSGVGHVQLIEGVPNLLVRSRPDKPQWQRLPPDHSVVGADDQLMVPPGFRGAIRFDTGVGLYLWGNLPDLLSLPLLESGVFLHAPGDADLDLTLDRGRVLIFNDKAGGPVRVRVRFNEDEPGPAEAWELTLEEPNTEVGIDLFRRYSRGVPFRKEGGEGPLAELYLVVLHGRASIHADGKAHSLGALPSGPALLAWDNNQKEVTPQPFDSGSLRAWDRDPPQTKAAEDDVLATKELLAHSSDKPVEVTLHELLRSDRPASRVLAVFSLGALDAVAEVVDALYDKVHEEVRGAAVMALRQWVSRRADHDRKLYRLLQEQQRYTAGQAEAVVQLLHDFSGDQLKQPETWEVLIEYLRHEKPAIRTLAYWHLYRLVPEGRGVAFEPIGDIQQRERAYDAWKKLIPDGKLPPAPKGQPSPSARNAADLPDIISGKALNQLVDAIAKGFPGRKAPGPPILLDEETIKHLNLTTGQGAGSVRALMPARDGSALPWPAALLGEDYRDETRRLNQRAAEAIKLIQNTGQVDPGTLNDLKADLATLRSKISAHANDLTPAQSIEARRFLDDLDAARTALAQPDAKNYFNGKYDFKGKTVAELVDHMITRGLRFARATGDDEAAYKALYDALHAYWDGLQAKEPKD